ncbi:MAG TPA: hypothetical protein VF814_11635 [Casimicrobiaceae bacterium]
MNQRRQGVQHKPALAAVLAKIHPAVPELRIRFREDAEEWDREAEQAAWDYGKGSRKRAGELEKAPLEARLDAASRGGKRASGSRTRTLPERPEIGLTTSMLAKLRPIKREAA